MSRPKFKEYVRMLTKMYTLNTEFSNLEKFKFSGFNNTGSYNVNLNF